MKKNPFAKAAGKPAEQKKTTTAGNESFATALAPAGAQGAAAVPRRKNWFARHKKLTVALAVLLVLAFAAWRFLSAAVPASTVSYQYVRTTTLQKTSLENSVTATGTVAAGSEASVTVADGAKLYTIATVEVAVGDEVQAGDVIATLDTADLQKEIEQAEQSYADDLQSAQTTYDRAVQSYEVSAVQHENRLIDLQEDIDEAEAGLAEAQQALADAQAARDSARGTVDSLQSAYNAVQGAASYVSAYDAAVDALATATAALDTAGGSYNTAYLNYTSAADDAAKAAALAELESAARSLESAWAVYGSGAGLQTALAANESVSAGNRRAVAATTAPDIASVNAQLSAAGMSLSLQAPAADTLAENLAAAARALANQESAAAAGTGMTYQQVVDSYTAAQTALTQAESQLTSAQTQVKTAETQAENAYDSYDSEKNSTTLTSLYQQIEDAELRLEQAQRTPDTLTSLRDTLDDCTLTATMSGTVTALNATVGSVCGETVATIQDTDGLTVEITLSADDVTAVAAGMSCTIASDATGEAEITGTLVQIDPVANEQGTFGAQVQVNTADSGLLIGIQAQVEIIQNVTEGVFVVPIDAVGTAEDGSSFVYRQTGGTGVDMTFEEVPVTTGAANDYYIEISGDTLTEGDVIRATADLTEGIETAEIEENADFSMMPGMSGGSMDRGLDMGGGSMPDMPDMGGGSMPDMGGFNGGGGGGAPGGM